MMTYAHVKNEHYFSFSGTRLNMLDLSLAFCLEFAFFANPLMELAPLIRSIS